MGRRELRDELQSTWCVYEPRVAGAPMSKKDLEDADELSREVSTIHKPSIVTHALLARFSK